jgi:PAS domain S-box-containing protein
LTPDQPNPSSLRAWIAASPVRLFVAFLVLAGVPLLLVNLRIGASLKREMLERDFRQNSDTARLTASFLEEHFKQSEALLQASAENPEFRVAWSKRDLRYVQAHMEAVLRLDPNFSLVSVYTSDGTMVAIAPQTTNVVGSNFAYRDWYQGLVRDWQPYVSEVYRTRASGNLAVAVAVPVKDEAGKPVGLIAAAYSLKNVSSWLGDMKMPSRGNIFVVDQNGRLLANPAIDVFAEPVDMNALEPVQKVRQGLAGDGIFMKDGHLMLMTYRPIPSFRWGVVVMEPMAELEAQMSAARRQQWLNSSALILLALVGGGLLGYLYESQQKLRGRMESLRASEQHYRSLIQGAVMGMYRVNDTSILVVNAAMVSMLRYGSEEELLALPVEELFYEPGERLRIRQEFRDETIVDGVETVWKRKDGSPIDVRVSGRYERDAAGNFQFFEGLAEDISGRKYLEEQLRHSEKQAALGRMVAGAAHEINNPLTGVLGYLEMIVGAESPEERRELVEKARSQARRVRTIVANLLSFAKQRKAQKQMLDVNRIIDNAMRLQDLNVAPGRVSFRTGFDVALPPVWGDEYQLLQVFLHVLNNAVDAVPREGGGIVTARTKWEGDFVLVDIEDNGHGIAEIAHVFDPFYTTKEVGKGAGLGLSACYGIVHEHGGDITAENLPEGGARIRIKLPIADDVALPFDQGSAQTAK